MGSRSTSRPEALERLSAWSAHRQRLDQRAASPLQALQDVIAVYSTHPTAPLALLARTENLKAGDFSALEQRRQAVRIVGMRGSAFLVPASTAGMLLAATRTPLEKLAGTFRYAGLDLETYQRLVPRVLECCSTPVTPTQLRACFPVPEDVYMVARILARQGQILRVGGSLRTDQLKYVATTAWLGQPFSEVDRSEALIWLAQQYLRAFGPARVADFAWWCGCTRREAAAVIAKLETVEREALLLLEEDAAAFDRLQPLDPERIDVRPKWDSYTMAYAPDGRARFVDDAHLKLAYTSVAASPGATAGDGLPLLLKGGRAFAMWSHRFSGNQLSAAVALFEGSKTAPIGAATFQRVAELLGAASLTVTN